MKSFIHTVQDPMGLHARPAGALVKEVKKYESAIVIKKDEKVVQATKIMGIMGLGIKGGEKMGVEIVGTDEELAYNNLLQFCTEQV